MGHSERHIDHRKEIPMLAQFAAFFIPFTGILMIAALSVLLIAMAGKRTQKVLTTPARSTRNRRR